MKTDLRRHKIFPIAGFLVIGLVGLLLGEIQSALPAAAGNTSIDQRFPPPSISGVTPIVTPAPGARAFDAYTSFQYSLNGRAGTFRYEFLQTSYYPALGASNEPWSFTASDGQMEGLVNGTYNGHVNGGTLVFGIASGTGYYVGATGILTATARPEYADGQPYMILTGLISIPDLSTPTPTPTATATPGSTPAPTAEPTAVDPALIPRSYFPFAQKEIIAGN